MVYISTIGHLFEVRPVLSAASMLVVNVRNPEFLVAIKHAVIKTCTSLVMFSCGGFKGYCPKVVPMNPYHSKSSSQLNLYTPVLIAVLLVTQTMAQVYCIITIHVSQALLFSFMICS